MLQKTHLFILLASIPFSSIAQEQLSRRQRADQLFERYEYSKSAELYESLLGGKHDTRILERLGDCNRLSGKYELAERYYASACMYKDAAFSSFYYYAEALLANQKPEAAKTAFNNYFTRIPNPQNSKTKLASCDSAAAWMKQKQVDQVENVQKLNSVFSEWGLVDDGADFILTSDRITVSSVRKTDQRTGNNWMNLYSANLKELVSREIKVSSEGIPNLKPGYHIGPLTLNTSRDTAYITISTPLSKSALGLDPQFSSSQRLFTRRLELMMATKNDGGWELLSRFPYNNARRYSIGHAALSPNGQLIYFTSDMPGGEGKTDIWYCGKLPDGSWGKPVNCGKVINTAEEEAFPFMDEAGILYFSSKGLPGMGGFDLFSAKGSKTIWARPVNLKYPVNSTRDDFSLSTKDGFSGYFSSDRKGGKGGDDIYHFMKPKKLDSPEILLTDPLSMIALSQGKAHSEEKSTRVEPVKKQPYYAVRNIYYDLDKSNIRPDATKELDNLAKLLEEYPSLIVELYSHTDSRASKEYNQKLSERRSEATRMYLLKSGISNDRISTRSFGENQLLNGCPDGVNCSEVQHQSNRRTEIVVKEP